MDNIKISRLRLIAVLAFAFLTGILLHSLIVDLTWKSKYSQEEVLDLNRISFKLGVLVGRDSANCKKGLK